MDLFALKCNTKLATCISLIPEPEIWKVESSQIMGRSVRLCTPTNGSDQADSEQVNIAQSRTPFGQIRNGFWNFYNCQYMFR